MPQMSPLNWMIISPLLILILSFSISFLYFLSFPEVKISQSSNNPSINWSW